VYEAKWRCVSDDGAVSLISAGLRKENQPRNLYTGKYAKKIC